MALKRTPLYQWHVDHGAHMVEFAGFEMPLYYNSIKEEHLNVREGAGLFDISHMGELLIYGPEAFDFLQYATTNDVGRLKRGQAQYTLLLNEAGGIIDDAILYKLDDDRFMLVVNAANTEKDFNWLNHLAKGFNVDIEDVSDQMALIAIQGPRAQAILSKLSETDLFQIPYYHFVVGAISGFPNVIISNTGYTGSGGFELYMAPGYAKYIWEELLHEGKDEGLVPVGLGARDTLRLEMGYRLYGNDMDESTSPLEAGLNWVVHYDKDFVGREALLKQKEEGFTRRLRGFVVEDRLIPRKGYEIVDREGTPVGTVTSGGFGYSINKVIGMGYIDRAALKNKSDLFLKARNRTAQIKLSKLPFYKDSPFVKNK
ncbi:MAG: glycine cleavage system aminomethyltransferase GcvT [Chlorobi bacterium]|nr:glycine cleavage system aminomethyltransferase GcvT [Chlorobiota bacterium]